MRNIATELVRFILICTALNFTVAACSTDELPEAPSGEYQVLERLAATFRNLSDGYPQGPAALPAKERKAFVERVFKLSGYSYSRTLLALAQKPIDTWDRGARDLRDLVLFPIKETNINEINKGLYSAEELDALKKIQASL